jgi:hypothetical protein
VLAILSGRFNLYENTAQDVSLVIAADLAN